jgi:hypothetical protein
MSQRFGKIMGVAAAIVVLPLAAIALVALPLLDLFLFVRWQLTFGRRGIRALIVYSDSPKWKEHFEQEVLPLLKEKAHVVNTTHQPQWRGSSGAARSVHRRWGGHKNHTPVVIWFPPIAGKVKVIRFYQAYGRIAQHRNESADLKAAVASARALAHAGA